MSTRAWFTFALALIFVTGTAFAVTPVENHRTQLAKEDAPVVNNELDEVVYMEDFEGDVSDWVPTSPDIQDVYWQTDDWTPYAGTNAWRCFSPDYGSPDFGGYSDDWLQLMLSPAMDLSSASSVDFSFQFRVNAEAGDWDGGNVWVFYGNSPDDLTKELATPASPAYNAADLNAFILWFGEDQDWPGWNGQGAETFNTDYVEATFDLSDYTGYSVVHVVIAFSTDGGYNSGDDPNMFGFQVDDIVLDVDGSTVWADDADGNNIGGAPTFMTGAEAAGQDVLPYQWEIAEATGSYANPPSPTHIAGVLQDANTAFDQYLEGPEFTMPEVGPGETLWLDCYFNSDIEYTDNFPDELAWRPEVWDPSTSSWVPPATTGNYVYVGGNESTWEMFSTAGYTYDWDLTYLAGEEGVRLRLYFTSPDVDRTMTHHAVDDLFIVKNSLQHDLATQLVMPYPTTVGVANFGKVYLTNNGPNEETGFNAVWSYGGLVYPLFPAGLYTLGAGDTMQLSINDPTDPDHEGYLVPETEGAITVDAYHTMANDEIPDNDNSTAQIDILAEGMYEVGMDTRVTNGLVSVAQENDGPLVHIDPAEANGSLFSNYFDNWDLQYINAWVTYHGAANGAPANPQMTFKVYEGGATPGALIWSGDYVFDGVQQGDTGSYLVNFDVSDVAQLQDLTGSFYVQAVVTQLGNNGEYYQPFIDQTAAYDPWQPYQFQNMDNASEGTYDMDNGHHITVTMYQDPASAEELTETGIPTEFALGQAYPNPFNPSTTISFNVAATGNVSLVVYNVMGQEVARLADRQFQPGTYNATFNAAALSSGVYFIRMDAPAFSAVQKIMLMK